MATKAAQVPSSRPYFPPDEVTWLLQEFREVLESGALTRGSRIKLFESLFAESTGTRHAVAVSNGTVSLEIILRYFAAAGAEVIVPTNTFLASANAVVFAGGFPVFADMDAASLCIGLHQVKAAVTERTRGVMVVHIAGLICPEIEAIRDFCKDHGLFLVEDAAHAHGAERKGVRAGNLADASSFSFYPTKVLTTAEGGMITTNDDALDAFARIFRNHGVPEGHGLHEALGHNCRLDELRAVLGISQVRKMDEFLTNRREIAHRYEQGLGALRGHGIEVVGPPEGIRHSYYKFPVVLPSRPVRDDVARRLKEKHGIDTGTVYWPPCHLQPVVRSRPELYICRGTYPVAEDVLPRVLCLPIHARLTASGADRVMEALQAELAEAVG